VCVFVYIFSWTAFYNCSGRFSLVFRNKICTYLFAWQNDRVFLIVSALAHLRLPKL